MTLNDGGGLWDNQGVIDTIIVDLNQLPRLLIENQFLQACATLASIGQRLKNLQNGIKNDMNSKTNQIEELKRINADLYEQLTGLPVDKEGAEHD